VVHQRNCSYGWFNFEPVVFDYPGVDDPGSAGIGPKAGSHGGRGLNIDDLSATQGERQRDSACAPSDIDDDVIRLDVRRDDL